jgi:hypothetical protein
MSKSILTLLESKPILRGEQPTTSRLSPASIQGSSIAVIIIPYKLIYFAFQVIPLS